MGGDPFVGSNLWDARHNCLLQQLSADLLSAGVGVLVEPGALHHQPERGDGDASDAGDPDYERKERSPWKKGTAPDQLITYAAVGKKAGTLARITTDISVCETNTAAVLSRKISVGTVLANRAREKVKKHAAPARAAGCAFVPLVFSSLGAMHPQTAEFLTLNDMYLDEAHMEREFGGRRWFIARMIDGLSCALARATARMTLENATEFCSTVDKHPAKLRVRGGLRRFPPGGA
jgi:hypothetical protein